MKALLRMRNSATPLISILAILFLVAFTQSCDNEDGAGTIILEVSINWEGEPLKLDQAYQVDQGTLTVEDFKFYLSNLNFQGQGANYSEPESYHLIGAVRDGSNAEVIIDQVPAAEYSIFSYGIGVDPDKNLSTDNDGDLDPTNQMAWNWDTGYKFVLFEGKLDTGNEVIPLVYHIGFSENFYYKVESIDGTVVTDGGTAEIELRVNVEQMFKNPNLIDPTVLNDVMFNKEDAALIVENYQNGMFSVE